METKIKTMADFKIAMQNNTVTGYIWMVEEQQPFIFKNKKIDLKNLNKTGNLHNKIQEAYLYDSTNSYHIKNIDGEENVFIFNEADFTNTDLYKIDDEIEYPSHIEGIENLLFKQVYKLMPSISGDDYTTWQPIVRLFKGFSNQPKNN